MSSCAKQDHIRYLENPANFTRPQKSRREESQEDTPVLLSDHVVSPDEDQAEEVLLSVREKVSFLFWFLKLFSFVFILI